MQTRLLAAIVVALVVVAACGDDAAEDSTGTTPASPTSVDETTSATGGTAPTPFPRENFDVTHGGTTWAVVLAGAGESDDPVLGAAQEAADDAGYETGPTDCDEGAAAALGLDGSSYTLTVSVYFSSEADARQAYTAFEERGVRGAAVAEVSTYCLD